MARADKPLLHTLETRGLLHTRCRAMSRGYKRLRIGGLVAPGAHLLHTPCNGVCRVCGPWPCYKPLVLTRSHMLLLARLSFQSVHLLPNALPSLLVANDNVGATPLTPDSRAIFCCMPSCVALRAKMRRGAPPLCTLHTGMGQMPLARWGRMPSVVPARRNLCRLLVCRQCRSWTVLHAMHRVLYTCTC